MNKFDRVISTLVLLQTKKIIKAQSISERFGISLRTVYRDISTLKSAGIPIIGDPGIGYSVMDGYRLPPLMFNEGEAAALLTAEKFMVKLTDKNTQEQYSSAMMKIKAILRSSEKQSLATLDSSIEISDANSWDHKAYLQDLFKSIAGRNILDIQYQKADGKSSQRSIEPIGCYYQFNSWYVVAYCQLQKDYRTFKMNRIVSLQVKDLQYDEKHPTLQDYIDRQDDSWKEQQQFQSIEIAFDVAFVQYAERRKYYFGFVAQNEMGDAVHMKFLNSSIEVIARWLLQFGDKATVLSPALLKERVKTLATDLYHHYN